MTRCRLSIDALGGNPCHRQGGRREVRGGSEAEELPHVIVEDAVRVFEELALEFVGGGEARISGFKPGGWSA